MAFRGQGMKRRFSFGRQGRRLGKPARQWLPIPLTSFFSAQASTGIAQVLAFEAPTITPGTAVTADPPEDQVLDRIVAEFTVQLAGAGSWTLGMMVVDRTWTPVGGEFATDADKRVLWYQTYDSNTFSTLAGFTGVTWSSPNHLLVTATSPVALETDMRAVKLDITPKIRLEDGKALIFCAWEDQGTATLSLTVRTMRLLMHRAGRR